MEKSGNFIKIVFSIRMLCVILPQTHSVSRAFGNNSINESLFKWILLLRCVVRTAAPSVESFSLEIIIMQTHKGIHVSFRRRKVLVVVLSLLHHVSSCHFKISHERFRLYLFEIQNEN